MKIFACPIASHSIKGSCLSALTQILLAKASFMLETLSAHCWQKGGKKKDVYSIYKKEKTESIRRDA
jgi:hypothetical protein